MGGGYHDCQIVSWRQLGLINSFTLEASFAGSNIGPLANCHYTIQDLEVDPAISLSLSFSLSFTFFLHMLCGDAVWRSLFLDFFRQCRLPGIGSLFLW